jgi:quinol monooxygenase YgiN
MHHLQIEHPISDFGTWKGAFDSFADFRQQSGVRRYRVLQPTDDPNYVIIELEFDSSSEAEAFLAALRRNVWSSREAAPALGGEPQTRIVEVVEAKEY